MRELRARLDALPLRTREAARPPRAAPAAMSFEVREQRIDVSTLGLTVVARSAPDPQVIAHLGLKGASPARWEDIVFLDTETTGLMGGTGTYVFLLGTAYFKDGELVLRQHLLHDLGAEAEFVRALSDELAPFRACASYNGKCFDLPLLRTRFVMALRSDLSVDESHLDLLHPARRLWRDRFGSTSLRQLEDSVLDVVRVDDIPGSLIPERYFRWLALRDPALIEPVLDHNARDIVSLIRITDRIAQAIIDARAGRAPDHAPAAFAHAKGVERAGDGAVAYLCYESAYADADSDLRIRVALPYARALEQHGYTERALKMVELLLEIGLGSPRWRLQAEARARRLTRRIATSRPTTQLVGSQPCRGG